MRWRLSQGRLMIVVAAAVALDVVSHLESLLLTALLFCENHPIMVFIIHQTPRSATGRTVPSL